MSDSSLQVPGNSTAVHELMDLLAKLFEAAKRLPPGSERARALEEIRGYQRRLCALLERK